MREGVEVVVVVGVVVAAWWVKAKPGGSKCDWIFSLRH